MKGLGDVSEFYFCFLYFHDQILLRRHSTDILLLFDVDYMLIECLAGQPHLLSERPLSRHGPLHLLELLSLYTTITRVRIATYLLDIVDLHRVRGLDVALLDQ